jgi:hypothetical protein
MTTKKKPIFEATPAELRYFADTILGLDGISRHHNTDTLLAKIFSVNPEITEIDVEEDVREHDQPTAAELVG